MYYLIEISDGDSKIKGKAIYEYATVREAMATFHSKMGSAMKSDLYTREMLMVIDENGHVVECKVHEIPTVEEPTVEVDEPIAE